MHLYTSLQHDEVVEIFRRGQLGTFGFDSFRQTTDGKWAGDWEYGVLCIDKPDDEDLEDLQKNLDLPLTLHTRIWINCEPVYEGQTGVYQMTAVALKEWGGDMALLHDGDSVRVQRIGDQVSLREDCLNPERLRASLDRIGDGGQLPCEVAVSD